MTSDETQVKDENVEEPDGERDRRLKHCSKDKDKISTNDAKSLKPEVLETNLPPLQIKDWYRKWENYQLASGWGQGDNHRTQLAYLHTCISDEIRTAINFKNMDHRSQTTLERRSQWKPTSVPCKQ